MHKSSTDGSTGESSETEGGQSDIVDKLFGNGQF